MHSTALVILLVAAATAVVDAKEQYSNAQMVCLVNKERSRYGLKALQVNDLLTKAAQGHSDYQARSRRMGHNGAGGSDPGKRCRAAGYNWKSVGENVAYGYNTMTQVMKVWMGSPGHRANILGKQYTCMGSAVAYSGSTPYYTQNFASGSGGKSTTPKCDGSDGDYNAEAGGNEYGGDEYGGNMGGGDDYGGNMGGGDDYGGEMPRGGRRGGRQGGRQNDNYGGDYGNDNYGGDYGNDNYGGDYGNDNYGDDYGNDTYGDEMPSGGGRRGGRRGGKKPCKNGGQQGGNDYGGEMPRGERRNSNNYEKPY